MFLSHLFVAAFFIGVEAGALLEMCYVCIHTCSKQPLYNYQPPWFSVMPWQIPLICPHTVVQLTILNVA